MDFKYYTQKQLEELTGQRTELIEEECTGRIIEERKIIIKTGKIVMRCITRYYPDCDRRLYYIEHNGYGKTEKTLKFFNNSNNKPIRVEIFRYMDGTLKESMVYGIWDRVDGINAEGYKLIKTVLETLKNDDVDFNKIYNEM